MLKTPEVCIQGQIANGEVPNIEYTLLRHWLDTGSSSCQHRNTVRNFLGTLIIQRPHSPISRHHSQSPDHSSIPSHIQFLHTKIPWPCRSQRTYFRSSCRLSWLYRSRIAVPGRLSNLSSSRGRCIHQSESELTCLQYSPRSDRQTELRSLHKSQSYCHCTAYCTGCLGDSKCPSIMRPGGRAYCPSSIRRCIPRRSNDIQRRCWPIGQSSHTTRLTWRSRMLNRPEEFDWTSLPRRSQRSFPPTIREI